MSGKLQWRVVQKIRAWGWSRTLGLAMAATAALVYLVAQRNLVPPLNDMQTRLANTQKTQPATASAEPQVVALKDLPAASTAIASLAELQNLAEERGLMQDSGQYKLEQDGGLVRYRLSLPVTGTYPAVRLFLSQALTKFPNLALDSLRISREQIGMSEVDAALQLSFYFRP